MLLQFTVENFLSFRDETTFSMLAAGSDAQHPNHLGPDAAGKGRDALRTTAIYGANGAGKSALIEAIGFAQELILDGRRSGQSMLNNPFKLSARRGEASKFDFAFTYQGIQYAYGFKVNATQVLEEWLYATPNKQEVTYFERQTTNRGRLKVEFGPKMKSGGKRREGFLEYVAEGTRPNQLLLTELAERNVEAIKPVMEWFDEVLLVIQADMKAENLEMRLHRDAAFTDFLGTLLHKAGTGVRSVRTETIPPGSGSLIEIKMQHLDENGKPVDFGFEEESEGTQRLTHLAPALFSLKNPQERVVILDELDHHLHTSLSKAFLEAFLDCDDSNSRNQLIFTTHDTNLLDLDLLRRDEICFVEKDEQGASHLTSLSEFKIRPDLQIEKGYLNGRFGAIPFLGNLCDLGWAKTESETQEEALPA